MASTHKTWCGVITAVAVMACAAILIAQGPLGPRPVVAPAQPLPGGQALPGGLQPGAQRITANRLVPVMDRNHDQVVADWLMIGNNEEVQMAKLASTHAEQQSVKQFAEQMEKEHGKALQKLEHFAGRNSQAMIQARMEPGEMHFLAVMRKISEQCLVTASKDMGAKQGIEFDRAYMGSQIGAHYRMIETMKVLRDYTSPELRMVINDELQTADSHLDHARTIELSLVSDNHSSK